MITFILSVVLLILGFLFYGKLVEQIWGSDDRITPAIAINDGVDYVAMPLWKVFLIQLLNIAGTGPIFGALSGAVFGPIVYLWIVLGCIFAGGVHDYMCGMLSMRNNGASVSELTGQYLGSKFKQIMRLFSVILLIMCGVVFTTGPATLLNILFENKIQTSIFLVLITIYYFIATFVPIDKIIGRFYPVFGVCLIFMAIGVGGSLLFSNNYVMPELWNNFSNHHANHLSVWPFMFITVACGAISGFHATQSPLMARCCQSERDGRIVFYGAMIAEGIIALVWAAAGVSVYENSQALLSAGAGCSAVVYTICTSTMGKVGGIIAIIGVIVCPISSGDTAYRSARLTLADWFHVDQAPLKNRLLLTVPLLAAGTIISQLDYNIVWRYFSWANQTLAMITLWTASYYLLNRKEKTYPNAWRITLIPAVFMTAVSTTYFFVSPECLGMLWESLKIPYQIYYPISVAGGILSGMVLYKIFCSHRRNKV